MASIYDQIENFFLSNTAEIKNRIHKQINCPDDIAERAAMYMCCLDMKEDIQKRITQKEEQLNSLKEQLLSDEQRLARTKKSIEHFNKTSEQYPEYLRIVDTFLEKHLGFEKDFKDVQSRKEKALQRDRLKHRKIAEQEQAQAEYHFKNKRLLKEYLQTIGTGNQKITLEWALYEKCVPANNMSDRIVFWNSRLKVNEANVPPWALNAFLLKWGLIDGSFWTTESIASRYEITRIDCLRTLTKCFRDLKAMNIDGLITIREWAERYSQNT